MCVRASVFVFLCVSVFVFMSLLQYFRVSLSLCLSLCACAWVCLSVLQLLLYGLINRLIRQQPKTIHVLRATEGKKQKGGRKEKKEKERKR